MANQTISQSDLNSIVLNFVKQLEAKAWGSDIAVEGLPKEFTLQALEAILMSADQTAADLMASATGIAYLRGHSCVTEDDVSAAIEVRAKGVEQVLPARNEEE